MAAIAYVLGWYVIAQVLAGGLVVLLVYLLALLVMRTDRLVRPAVDVNDPSSSVKLLAGHAPTAVASNRTWTSANVDARNYAPLTRSVNRRGGAQFTYSFWMNVGDPSPANVRNKTILLRGIRDVVNWTKTTKTASLTDPKANPTTVHAPQSGVLVKCPLIRFGDTYDSLVVEFNTVHDPSARVAITPTPASTGDPTLRANLLKMTVNKWALHTFVFEDHVPISDFEDGVSVRYYLNDTLYHTGHVPSTLVQNHGDLYLLPTSGAGEAPLSDCRIGDVTYHNHARTPAQVRAAFVDGPPTEASNDLVMGGRDAMPLVLSEFNRLDVYNTSM